jgi:hypothetical protein
MYDGFKIWDRKAHTWRNRRKPSKEEGQVPSMQIKQMGEEL